MKLVRIRDVNTVRGRPREDGTRETYYYFRRLPNRRLRGEPGTREFLEDYALAVSECGIRSDKTVGSLIRDFSLSPEFSALADTTKVEYRRIARVIEDEFGQMPIETLEEPAVRRIFLGWRDRVAQDHPREADNRITFLCRVINFGLDRSLVQSNPLQGVRKIYRSDRSDKIWLPQDIEAFEAVADDEMRLALQLALNTGQRQGDLLKLPWSAYDGNKITLVQSKTGRRVVVPCTSALKAALDAAPKHGPLILMTKTGRAFKKRYFIRRWAEIRTAAGIEGLNFYDLRGTAVTRLAEAGATEIQIAAITGHSTKTISQMLKVYLRQSDALAEGGIAKLENALATNSAKHLQNTAAGHKKGSVK